MVLSALMMSSLVSGPCTLIDVTLAGVIFAWVMMASVRSTVAEVVTSMSFLPSPMIVISVQ